MVKKRITAAPRQLLQRLALAFGITYPRRRIALWWARRHLPHRTPAILRELEHDPDAFTQGLLFHEGSLYESTGLFGASTLRRLDPQTGAVLQTVSVERHWAEGIAILGANLYQLTYECGRCLVYRLPDLTRVGELRFEGEGWGLTSDGSSLILSNGSAELRFYSSNMELQRSLQVRLGQTPLEMLNDLTFTGKHIVANVLHVHDEHIYAISPTTGVVERVLDGRELTNRSGRRSADHVLNGIAYVPERDTFFATGKYWPKLFEVSNPLTHDGRAR